MQKFPDRRAAGRALARRLRALGAAPRVIVLALPRGGVPVAFEVATTLNVPLDVLVVRKLGVPHHEEFAFGAIASAGMQVVDDAIIAELRIPPSEVASVVTRERHELARRELLYRGTRPFPDLAGSNVILVDDGIATGSTMRAAVAAVRTRKPAHVIVAAPVASHQAAALLEGVADACVFTLVPDPFYAVGVWYDDFSETSDDEVLELLSRGRVPDLAGVVAT